MYPPASFFSSKNYKTLISVLDSILLSRSTSIYRLSNSLLTFVRPGVTDLRPHQVLSLNYFYLRLIFLLFSKVLPVSILCARSLIASFSTLRLPSTPCNCLLISYLVDRQTLTQQDDFYYNRIQSILSSAGNTTSLLYINSIPGASSLSRASWNSNKYILPTIPPFYILVQALWGSLFDSLTLVLEVFSEPSPFRARALLLAAIHSFTTASLLTSARSLLISRCVATCEPTSLFLLYEGHPWERASIASSRLANPSLTIFAYQHATLFPYQHSIQRPLSANSEPDFLLTSGRTSNTILSRGYAKSTSSPPLCLIGSPRCHTSQLDKSISPSLQRILLLPDGTLAECQHYLDLAIELSERLPTTDISIRFHPLVDITKICAHLNADTSSLPSNLRISSLSLQADIASSTHAIYSGSSSITAAALSGLFCLRYDYSADSLLRDPFALTSYSPPSFADVDQCCYILESSFNRSSFFQGQLLAAQTLYSPFTPELILTLIAGA